MPAAEGALCEHVGFTAAFLLCFYPPYLVKSEIYSISRHQRPRVFPPINAGSYIYGNRMIKDCFGSTNEVAALHQEPREPERCD